MNLKSIMIPALLLLAALGMASCDDNLVYEKEGDCTPKVQFVFKKHRQALHSQPGREADVFYATVGTVHLFVFDEESGELVYEQFENTENLQSASDLNIGSQTEKCYMPVDLNPGRYRFIAWCGLDCDDANNAFHLTNAVSRSGYEHCRVKHSDTTGHPVNDSKYDALYHGVKVADVTFDISGQQIIPIELTKNTNDITVWVQHTTQTFDKGDYEVVYTDRNGSMHFRDNSMTSDEGLQYHPHTTSILSAETEYNGNTVEAGAMVAHLSTARLMQAHAADAKLEVWDKDGKAVFSIPFIKYVLQMQTFVNPGSSKEGERDGQYYLDCEDTYNCSFYLTGDREQDGLWAPAMIIINNWVLVPEQKEEI